MLQTVSVTEQEAIRKNFDRLLTEAAEQGASDLHLDNDGQAVIRYNGELRTMTPIGHLSISPITAFDVLLDSLLFGKKKEEFERNGSTDISLCYRSKTGEKSCRCHVFRHSAYRNAMAIRFFPSAIPSCKTLGLPDSLTKLTREEHGLIIVSGPTGSGKTTTIASLLDWINETYGKHIITVEDPIEYVLKDKTSLIHQREVGMDCPSFAAGLKAALREDPDVILVGEMRDAETIATAISAAETGHLVFSTLHTANVVEAVDRLVQYFPADHHTQIRNELAVCFKGIIAQKLFPCTKGGRVAAFEILLPVDATKNVIRKGENHRLYDYMHPSYGMQTMEQAIEGLKKKHLME